LPPQKSNVQQAATPPERVTRRISAATVGALSRLPQYLADWSTWKIEAGDFHGAATLIAEAEAVGEVIGQPHDYRGYLEIYSRTFDEALGRFHEQHRCGHEFDIADCIYQAIALNGAGRCERALEFAQRSCDAHRSAWWDPRLLSSSKRQSTALTLSVRALL